MLFAAVSVLAMGAPGLSTTGNCPPTGFNTQGGLDINWYANGTWHVQQQMPISYLKPDYNFCVTATYTQEKPTFLGYTVNVHNSAVDKNCQPPSGPKDICGKVLDAVAGKLEVAPCFIPTALSGPYWVVAYNVTAGWALVSGGPPTIDSNGLCKTGTGTNGSGLWIFTRKEARDEAVVAEVRAEATKKGFDVSVLNDIDNTNCNCKPPSTKAI